jgi:hypothetical protein
MPCDPPRVLLAAASNEQWKAAGCRFGQHINAAVWASKGILECRRVFPHALDIVESGAKTRDPFTGIFKR